MEFETSNSAGKKFIVTSKEGSDYVASTEACANHGVVGLGNHSSNVMLNPCGARALTSEGESYVVPLAEGPNCEVRESVADDCTWHTRGFASTPGSIRGFSGTAHSICDDGGKGTLNLKLNVVEGKDGLLKVSLHLFDKFSHTTYNGDGDVYIQNPTNAKCKMVGGVRHKHIVPHFQDNGNFIINRLYFNEIFDTIRDYDGLNGHILPSTSNFTDAFCDPRGAYKQCPSYWSVVDNAFKHPWKNTNIYAFPPGEDDFILKTLQYHCLQQSMAQQKGESFRGVYVVPYRPRAKYWKFVQNFMILKMYRKGTPFFSPAPKTPKASIPSPIPCPYPMCVLYDPGYTEPNVEGAFCNALEKCSEAIANYDIDEHDLFTSFLQDEVLLPREGIPCVQAMNFTPHALHASHEASVGGISGECFDGMIEEVPNETLPYAYLDYVLPFECVVANLSECVHSELHDRGQSLKSNCLHDVLRYNMMHCSEEPYELANQFASTHDNVHDSDMQVKLRCMRSVGKLGNILDQDDPDMGEVDAAIKEHMEALQAEHDLESKDEVVGHDLFDKDWTQGGLLPLSRYPFLRHIAPTSGYVDEDDRCLVVKTRMFDNICNTSLSDEGATNSVFNIDWYEHHGYDWKALLGITW
jgi:hypothetical protein